MIRLGANDWNKGLDSVCDDHIQHFQQRYEEYLEIAILMLLHGCTRWSKLRWHFPNLDSKSIIRLHRFKFILSLDYVTETKYGPSNFKIIRDSVLSKFKNKIRKYDNNGYSRYTYQAS